MQSQPTFTVNAAEEMTDAELIREYHRLLNLCAKTPTQLRLERLLEDELARRFTHHN